MKRKRLTQIFPFLLPIRKWQRKLFYTIKMKFDKNKYAKRMGTQLEHEICNAKTLMINEHSGHNIIYQRNKVYNLKLVSKTINNILIYPNETFSFYYLSKNSKRFGKLKNGLVLQYGKIVPEKGGGLCHLSNFLYYLFLKSPLTIIERHSHSCKSFPNPDKNSLDGIDATISEGWLDLKVKNETNNIYQINLSFDEKYMYGKILSNKKENTIYEITNENIMYLRENNKIYEYVDVVRIKTDKETNIKQKEKLYDEKILIEYELDKNIEVVNL